jgi:hypothetical protein
VTAASDGSQKGVDERMTGLWCLTWKSASRAGDLGERWWA